MCFWLLFRLLDQYWYTVSKMDPFKRIVFWFDMENSHVRHASCWLMLTLSLCWRVGFGPCWSFHEARNRIIVAQCCWSINLRSSIGSFIPWPTDDKKGSMLCTYSEVCWIKSSPGQMIAVSWTAKTLDVFFEVLHDTGRKHAKPSYYQAPYTKSLDHFSK